MMVCRHESDMRVGEARIHVQLGQRHGPDVGKAGVVFSSDHNKVLVNTGGQQRAKGCGWESGTVRTASPWQGRDVGRGGQGGRDPTESVDVGDDERGVGFGNGRWEGRRAEAVGVARIL